MSCQNLHALKPADCYDDRIEAKCESLIFRQQYAFTCECEALNRHQTCRPPVPVRLQIHGWLLCLGWGFFIPAGIVVASFRTLTKQGSSWWYYIHVVFASAGFLATLAGIAVGCYFPADNALMVQHKIIGIVVTAAGGLQVTCAMQFCVPTIQRAVHLQRYTG